MPSSSAPALRRRHGSTGRRWPSVASRSFRSFSPQAWSSRRMAVPCARRVGKSSSGPSVAHCATKKESRRRRQCIGTSYRTGRSTIMHIFKRREQAIAAAPGFLNRGDRHALEVGPKSGNPDGTVLDERDLSQLWDKSLGAATPVPFAQGDRGQAQEPDHWRRSHG
jgi:hypothetical protein